MAMPNADWMDQAACRNENARLFFTPEDKEPREDRSIREQLAKAVCERCDVSTECLRYALTNRERQGIWGGRTEAERLTLI